MPTPDFDAIRFAGVLYGLRAQAEAHERDHHHGQPCPYYRFRLLTRLAVRLGIRDNPAELGETAELYLAARFAGTTPCLIAPPDLPA